MLNVGATIGDDPMISAGLSLRLGREKSVKSDRREAMRRANEAEARVARMEEQLQKYRQQNEDERTLYNMRLTNMQEQLDKLNAKPSAAPAKTEVKQAVKSSVKRSSRKR